MRLCELLHGLKTESPYIDCDVRDIVIDSRKVGAGSVFVCLVGRNFDGHDMAEAALKAGAVAVVTQRLLGLANEIVVEDTRFANAVLCQNFFGNPQHALKIIAVTGTNGKTTVANVIKQALEQLGQKAGLIGTIQSEIGDIAIPAKFTTPEPWDLYALMARMVAAGCTHLVMEASSQALAQGRLLNLQFACGVFTNLTQDHLDYHGTMADYYAAKKLLFAQCDTAVVNIDDSYGRRLSQEIDTPKTITFSTESNEADYTAKNIELSICGVSFALSGREFICRIAFPAPGAYSVENALAAVCALFATGIDRDAACAALSKTHGVRGRSEILHAGDVTVVCDFAHTADALEQLLASLRPFAVRRLVALFGCSGDRDKKKRPAMAEAVCKYADYIVLTSDNPRTEDPVAIINEVVPIIEQKGIGYIVEPDRYLAILWALEHMESGDVLVLCGKGHEDYQVIDGYTIYLDEHRIVADFFGDDAKKDV